MKVKKFEEFINEKYQDDSKVIDELKKLYKNDEDKADSKFSAFKKGADLNQKRQYWDAVEKGKFKRAAKLIKKVWG